MNAHTTIAAERPVSEVEQLRRQLQAERSKVIRLRGMVKRGAWAMLGLANAAERFADTTYWRELAADLERRADL
jgi:nitrogen fixation protein FixH